MDKRNMAFKLCATVVLALIAVLATGAFYYEKKVLLNPKSQEFSQFPSSNPEGVVNSSFPGLSVFVTPPSVSATSSTPGNWDITIGSKVIWKDSDYILSSPRLATTTDPEIALLTDVTDGGFGVIGPIEYLINVQSEKVIGIENLVDPDNPPGIVIFTSPTSSLSIQTFPLGSCDAMSTITDFSLNDQPLHVLENSIPVGCIFHGGSGPAYQADVQLRATAISSDFSTLYFSFRVSGTDTKPTEQQFSIDLNNLHVQIAPEATSSNVLTL